MATDETSQCEPVRCRAYGASPIGDETVPLLELTTIGPCPRPWGKYGHSNAAHVIADALWATLPQGTLDALFAEFARRKASTLSVLYPEPSTAKQKGEADVT